MFKISIAAVAGIIALAAGAADAQNTRTVEKVTVTRPNGTMSKIELLKTGKRLETLNCRDYNALDVTYRPQALVYAANYGPHGRAHPTVTTEGVERFIPVVDASCRSRPGDHFTTAVHRAMMPAK